MGYHFQFKTNPIIAAKIAEYKQKNRIHNESYALQRLVKMGLDCYAMLNKDFSQVGLPIEIETELDRLTDEQRQRLLDLLAKKTGIRPAPEWR